MGLVQLIRNRVEQRSSVDPASFKGGVPVKNPLAVTRQDKGGLLIVSVPFVSDREGFMGVMARWMKAPDKKQFELDTVGAWVWERCDGRTNFSGISKLLQQKYKMNRLEADVALASYLRLLNRRGLITFLVRTKPKASARKSR